MFTPRRIIGLFYPSGAPKTDLRKPFGLPSPPLRRRWEEERLNGTGNRFAIAAHFPTQGFIGKEGKKEINYFVQYFTQEGQMHRQGQPAHNRDTSPEGP